MDRCGDITKRRHASCSRNGSSATTTATITTTGSKKSSQHIQNGIERRPCNHRSMTRMRNGISARDDSSHFGSNATIHSMNNNAAGMNIDANQPPPAPSMVRVGSNNEFLDRMLYSTLGQFDYDKVDNAISNASNNNHGDEDQQYDMISCGFEEVQFRQTLQSQQSMSSIDTGGLVLNNFAVLNDGTSGTYDVNHGNINFDHHHSNGTIMEMTMPQEFTHAGLPNTTQLVCNAATKNSSSANSSSIDHNTIPSLSGYPSTAIPTAQLYNFQHNDNMPPLSETFGDALQDQSFDHQQLQQQHAQDGHHNYDIGSGIGLDGNEFLHNQGLQSQLSGHHANTHSSHIFNSETPDQVQSHLRSSPFNCGGQLQHSQSAIQQHYHAGGPHHQGIGVHHNLPVPYNFIKPGPCNDLHHHNMNVPCTPEAYRLNKDPCPKLIHKPSPQCPPTYQQNIMIRYMRPPLPPKPGPIIIQEKRLPQPPGAPPLILRRFPKAPCTPPPLIFRECPPTPPCIPPPKCITKILPSFPPPARQIIIERYPPLPPKPRNIIFEKWLPYGPIPKRAVIVKKEKCTRMKVAPKNLIIQYHGKQPKVVKKFQCLGICTVIPEHYMARHGGTLIPKHKFNTYARNVGIKKFANDKCQGQPCGSGYHGGKPLIGGCHCGVINCAGDCGFQQPWDTWSICCCDKPGGHLTCPVHCIAYGSHASGGHVSPLPPGLGHHHQGDGTHQHQYHTGAAQVAGHHSHFGCHHKQHANSRFRSQPSSRRVSPASPAQLDSVMEPSSYRSHHHDPATNRYDNSRMTSIRRSQSFSEQSFPSPTIVI